MDEEYKPIITDEERATRRAQRAEARRKKQREKRRRLLRRLVPCGLLAVLCVGLVTVGAQLIEKPAPEMVKAERPFQVTSVASAPAPEPYARAVSGPDTIQLGEDFPSRCAVLVDLDTRTVLAEKNADTVISPASMTKVLTVLVAAEHITEAELDDTFTMTIDITDYCYVNGCSVVGLMVDETVPVRELFYGTILSSGADAARPANFSQPPSITAKGVLNSWETLSNRDRCSFSDSSMSRVRARSALNSSRSSAMASCAPMLSSKSFCPAVRHSPSSGLTPSTPMQRSPDIMGR